MSEAPIRLSVAAADLPRHIGKRLGPSRWVTIDQAMIDRFAALTGDDHWIHVDVERARRELPGGKTIAHGYLTLSLLTGLMGELVDITFTRALNYGHDRLRFTGAVPAGARVRLRLEIKAAEPVRDGGVRLTSACTMEVEGAERPAFIVDAIAIFYP
ncbi:MAG: MaoC family dehydratase [Candidatus Eiseniibacteriota bacterium]